MAPDLVLLRIVLIVLPLAESLPSAAITLDHLSYIAPYCSTIDLTSLHLSLFLISTPLRRPAQAWRPLPK